MKTDNVIQLHGLSRKEAERYIQEIARDSKRVFLSKHAKERMVERGVTRKELLLVWIALRFLKNQFGRHLIMVDSG